MTLSHETEFITLYESINRLDIDIVTDALQEAAIPYAIQQLGTVVGTRITIPPSHKIRADELLDILPISHSVDSPLTPVRSDLTKKPWINKVFLIALVYVALLALLYYSQK